MAADLDLPGARNPLERPEERQLDVQRQQLVGGHRGEARVGAGGGDRAAGNDARQAAGPARCGRCSRAARRPCAARRTTPARRIHERRRRRCAGAGRPERCADDRVARELQQTLAIGRLIIEPSTPSSWRQCHVRIAAARYPTTALLSPDTSPESAYLSTTAVSAPSCRAARITATVGPPPHACSGRTSSATLQPVGVEARDAVDDDRVEARRGARHPGSATDRCSPRATRAGRAAPSPSASPSARAVAGVCHPITSGTIFDVGRHALEERQLHLERVLAGVGAGYSRTIGDACINDSAQSRVDRRDAERRLEARSTERGDAVEADEVRGPDEDGDVERRLAQQAVRMGGHRARVDQARRAARQRDQIAPARAARRRPQRGVRSTRRAQRWRRIRVPAPGDRCLANGHLVTVDVSYLRVCPHFSREQVEAIAALAHLELDASELDLFARQLGEILDYADQVQQIDTTGVPPTASVVSRHAADRDDVVRPSLDRRDALANAPDPARERRPVQGAAGHRMTPVAPLVRECRDAVRERATDPRSRSARRRSTAIDALDPLLHAFNTVSREQALARAAAHRSRSRRAGAIAPLAGVPVALKDNLCTRGVRTTASSRILETFVPPYDATVVAAARSGRRDRRRQDQLRRVRDGIVDRELGVRPGAQSVGARSHSGRIERRLGGGRRRGHDAAGARIGHRRIDPAAGRAVRRRRA